VVDERRGRGRPVKRPDRVTGRPSALHFRGDLTSDRIKKIVEPMKQKKSEVSGKYKKKTELRDELSKFVQALDLTFIRKIDESDPSRNGGVVEPDPSSYLGFRFELARRTREILKRLKSDEDFLRRKWVSLKPLRRRGRSVPILDDRELSDLAFEFAKREMMRSLARREATVSRTLGAQKRISDDQLRAHLQHHGVRGARSIRAKAQLLREAGVPLSLRQLQTRIAQILPSSKSVK
jgi:hypothetical protein